MRRGPAPGLRHRLACRIRGSRPAASKAGATRGAESNIGGTISETDRLTLNLTAETAPGASDWRQGSLDVSQAQAGRCSSTRLGERCAERQAAARRSAAHREGVAVTEKISLPENCAGCGFFDRHAGKVCRRHAPIPGTEERERPFWPKVATAQRCGMGAARVADIRPKPCRQCIHWWQPGGKPVSASNATERLVEWWSRSGCCTRFAPGPTTEEGQATHWRVTHASDACGDGEVAEA
jgi:hypothetical protein